MFKAKYSDFSRQFSTFSLNKPNCKHKEVTNTTTDKATEEWLKAQKKSTRSVYKSYWTYFLQFTELTGDKIVESRKTDKEYEWEKKTLQFKSWMIKEGLSENSATTATQVVRGFFAYHRMPLKFRRTESAKLAEARPKYEDYRFSLEDLKKMFDIGDLEERYIITAGKSFGLRAGDFLKLTRGDLEAYLDRPVPISMGEYATQKEGINAYPFIDADALPIIKLMIEKMDREGRRKPTDRILTFKYPIQLSRTIQRLTQKAGINIGNKRVRFHCLRKFLIDRLSSFMSESKWKQIVGKAISEGAYVSPDSLRDDYARAMTEISFSKIIGEDDVVKLARLEALKQIAKGMGFTDEELSGISVKRKTLRRTVDDVIRDLEEQIKRRRQNTDCPNGHNCPATFKQIKENELLSHLQQGYTIVHRLQNGEVIVRR